MKFQNVSYDTHSIDVKDFYGRYPAGELVYRDYIQ